MRGEPLRGERVTHLEQGQAALGGIVGDSAVQRAHREWAQAWMFKHPSPWDYMFFMNKALGRDLSWFWNSWLFTTESVDARLASAADVPRQTIDLGSVIESYTEVARRLGIMKEMPTVIQGGIH